jgi:hypothetical protein
VSLAMPSRFSPRHWGQYGPRGFFEGSFSAARLASEQQPIASAIANSRWTMLPLLCSLFPISEAGSADRAAIGRWRGFVGG